MILQTRTPSRAASAGALQPAIRFGAALLRGTLRNWKELALTLGLPLFMLFTFWITTRTPMEFDLMGVMFPAIVSMSVMMSGQIHAMRMARWKEQGIADRLALSPVPLPVLTISAGVVQMLVGVGQGCAILLMGSLLGGIRVDAGGAVLSAGIMALAAFAFIAFGSMLAAFLPRPDAVGFLFFGIFLPLFFLGSFPADMLPPAMLAFLPWLPTTMTIELIGPLFYTGALPETAAFSIGGLTAYSAIFLIIAWWKNR